MATIRPKKSVGRRKKITEASKKKAKKKTKSRASEQSKQRKRKRGGTSKKPPIFPKSVMLQHLNQNLIPAMVTHCIIKVYRKLSGGKKQRFTGAYNICLATFQKYGYMYDGSLKRTAKGMKRNRKHQRETARGRKRRVYETMVTSIWGKEIQEMREQNRRRR